MMKFWKIKLTRWKSQSRRSRKILMTIWLQQWRHCTGERNFRSEWRHGCHDDRKSWRHTNCKNPEIWCRKDYNYFQTQLHSLVPKTRCNTIIHRFFIEIFDMFEKLKWETPYFLDPSLKFHFSEIPNFSIPKSRDLKVCNSINSIFFNFKPRNLEISNFLFLIHPKKKSIKL